jgi:hypothetical protein
MKTVPSGEQEEESVFAAAAKVDDLKTINRLYYDPSEKSSFSSRLKLETASRPPP